MSRFQFGTGVLYGKSVAGDQAANITPFRFGTLQDVQLEFAGTIKELNGQSTYPDDVAMAKMKVTGKAKLGQINAKMFNQLFFAETMSTGTTLIDDNHSYVIPTTPFQVTIAPPASGVFSEDLGVINSLTGDTMDRVASAPVAGQYSVNEATGVYTFASADNVSGVSAIISYAYTVTTGVNFIVNNHLQGYGPSFEIVLRGFYETNTFALRLYRCKSEKLTVPSKQGDYWIPEFDFQAYANPAGQVAAFYQSA